MKKIFIIIPWFDPAFKAGGPVQSVVNLVNEMKGMAAFFIFTNSKDVDDSTLEHVSTNEWCEYNATTKVWYHEGSKSFKSIQSNVEHTKPDVVFITGLFDYQFNILPAFFLKHPKKIVSVRGMLHPGALSQKPLKKRLFLSLLKSSGVMQRLMFHATDFSESEFIKKTLGTKQKIYIAANFPKDIGPQQHAVKSDHDSLKLLSIGLISPMKNYLLVLQALQKCEVNIQYTIAGAVKDREYWQACQNLIKTLPSNIVVNYIGEIEPARVGGLLQQADVFILPSKSENYGHAIIEALFASVPVVTSHHTPWNNLKEHHAGINVELDADALVEAIQFFAGLPDSIWKAWREGSRDYALKKTDTNNTIKQYQSMFGLQMQ